VTHEPGGTETVPQLATSWETSPDGTQWTFHLRSDVRFHDSTPFDAKAVCANFDRWYNFRGLLQSRNISGLWQEYFGGFAHPDDPAVPTESLYRSCVPLSEHDVRVDLTHPEGGFLTILTLPAFAIASPSALRKYDADKVSGTGADPKFDNPFSTDHPVGTGPFRFGRWDRSEKLVLERNEDYWGPKAKLARVIVRPIADASARRQALQSGEVQGDDLLEASDLEPLRRGGFQVIEPPPLNAGWLAFNLSRPPLDNLQVRQAIAYGFDRAAVVRAKYPPSAMPAKQFSPPNLFGYAPDARDYPHDPLRARELLADAHVANPTLELSYPTGPAHEPTLPDPEGVALAFKADMEKVGFTVTLRPMPPIPDLGEAIENGRVQVWLDSNYAFRADPEDLLGRSFRSPGPGYGFTNGELTRLLDTARREIDPARRTALYERVNRLLMDLLPGVPLVHVRPALAFSPHVRGTRMGPIPWESYASLSVA
jgi:peptide/nickel transport system substrate-binding protein